MSNSLDLKVEPLTVQAQTFRKLRDAILNGLFKPGMRLTEADLCEKMGVSRTSVREALRRLEGERLVTISPNRGPTVTQISWAEAQEIYHVRALLEGEAAALFATRATEAELRELRNALEEFRTAVVSDDALARLGASVRFYDVMLKGCGNRIIAEILEGLVARITFLRAQSMSLSGRSIHSLTEMERMVRAIESGKARAARSAATAHVKSASGAARKAYSQQTS